MTYGGYMAQIFVLGCLIVPVVSSFSKRYAAIKRYATIKSLSCLLLYIAVATPFP